MNICSSPVVLAIMVLISRLNKNCNVKNIIYLIMSTVDKTY